MFALSVNIVDENTHQGILAAGGDYGGEWARDASINAWNGVSLIRPKVALNSLWNVTGNKDSIAHQYWDKIIWVPAAWNHYKITGDRQFLTEAYRCAAKTMSQLEYQQFDHKTGLFMGPSVFNDGIAGYPIPIFEPGNLRSGVLDHKKSLGIKALSTNCIYMEAYACLAEMALELDTNNDRQHEARVYTRQSLELARNIREKFYNPATNSCIYFLDRENKPYDYQEGLGISYIALFGILSKAEAKALIVNAKTSPYGITSIYPDFERYSAEKPGRHNNLIWPQVNGFFAKAAVQTGNYPVFEKELYGLTQLALDPDKGNGDLKEIYNAITGAPDGGWQSDFHWKSCNKQTWSATAYIDMILSGIAGINFADAGTIRFTPYLPKGMREFSLTNIKYRKAQLTVNLSGQGSSIKRFEVNGMTQKEPVISGELVGAVVVDVVMGE